MSEPRQRNGRKRGSARGHDGRFAEGNPGGPGRPPGSPNLRTLAGQSLLKALEAGNPAAKLPSAFDRIARLLTDRDPRVRLGAERLVLGLLHGRPLNVDPEGEDGRGAHALDVAGLAMRMANFIAGAAARDPGLLAAEPENPET